MSRIFRILWGASGLLLDPRERTRGPPPPVWQRAGVLRQGPVQGRLRASSDHAHLHHHLGHGLCLGLQPVGSRWARFSPETPLDPFGRAGERGPRKRGHHRRSRDALMTSEVSPSGHLAHGGKSREAEKKRSFSAGAMSGRSFSADGFG